MSSIQHLIVIMTLILSLFEYRNYNRFDSSVHPDVVMTECLLIKHVSTNNLDNDRYSREGSHHMSHKTNYDMKDTAYTHLPHGIPNNTHNNV